MSGSDAPAAESRRPSLWRQFATFRRGPWENLAILLIALGVVMMTQTVSLWLYSWSFTFVLTGTLGFVVVSHFPE